MANSSISYSIKSILTCGICQGVYTNPKMLPCFHSFCYQCVKELQRQTKLLQPVQCPVCKHGVDIIDSFAIQALPSPFFIRALQDITSYKDDCQNLRCNSCSKHATATSFCFDCKFLVCRSCVQVHSYMKSMRTHRIIDLEDIRSPDMRELIDGTGFCSVKSHRSEQVHWYCYTCSERLCDICQTNDHKNHKVHRIKDAVQQIDEELHKSIDELNIKISSCKFVIDNMDSTYKAAVEQLVSVRKKVRDKINALVHVLRTHERMMLSQLEQLQFDIKASIFANKKDYEDILLQMVKTKDIVNEISERKIDIEKLSVHDSMLERIHELTGFPVDEKKHKSVAFDYSHNENVLMTLQGTDLGRIMISYTDPGLSEVTNENLHQSLTATGEQQIFNVITRDSEGNLSYSEDDRLTVEVESEEGYTIQPRIENTEDGNYQVTFTPLKPDTLVVSVRVMGEDILNSPFKMYVKSNREFLRESLRSDSTRSTGSDQGLDTSMSAVSVFTLNKGHFRRPCGICFNTSSDICAVADSKNRSVLVVGIEGKVLWRLGKDNNLNFKNPVGVTFDVDDTIYVTDSEDHVVKVFDPSGSCKKTFGSRYLERPLGICHATDGSSYICDSVSKSVKIFSITGSYQGEFKSPDLSPSGNAVAPYFVTQHKDKLFVTFDNHSVQTFDNQGNFLYKIGDKGHGEGRFKDPRGVAVDVNDRLFVCDSGNHRVQVFSEDGRISLVGSYGPQLGQFDKPQDVALANDGSAYITDYNNGRIQVFSYCQ